jgi:hypothetical protein
MGIAETIEVVEELLSSPYCAQEEYPPLPLPHQHAGAVKQVPYIVISSFYFIRCRIPGVRACQHSGREVHGEHC